MDIQTTGIIILSLTSIGQVYHALSLELSVKNYTKFSVKCEWQYCRHKPLNWKVNAALLSLTGSYIYLLRATCLEFKVCIERYV